MTFAQEAVYIIFVKLILLSFITQIESNVADSVPDGRIVGGVTTTIFEFPYQVSLRYRNRHRCGGSIVSPEVIVTAAHCVTDINRSYLTIRAGTTFKDYPGFDANVASIIIHESYREQTQNHDIALILLKDKLKYSNKIQAVLLNDKGTNNAKDIGKVAFVSGWGALSEGGFSPAALNYASVNIVSSEACSKAYYPTKITAGMICAEGSERDSCQGDSGGPLVVYNVTTPILVGVVSWGNGCARPGYPGVYAKVIAYREWIRKRVGV